MSLNKNRRPGWHTEATTGRSKYRSYGKASWSTNDLIVVLHLQNTTVLLSCLLLVVTR